MSFAKSSKQWALNNPSSWKFSSEKYTPKQMEVIAKSVFKLRDSIELGDNNIVLNLPYTAKAKTIETKIKQFRKHITVQKLDTDLNDAEQQILQELLKDAKSTTSKKRKRSAIYKPDSDDSSSDDSDS